MPHNGGMTSEVFREAGTIGDDLARVDWSRTALGEPEGWSRSLTMIVRTMLASRFSMWMAWGDELTFFCNDAYRRDTLGSKYPWALGRPAAEVWAEIWPDISDRVQAVVGRGESTWDEALQLFLERSGYREETYHTFSYSPLRDDDGGLAGLLCVVSEDTERVIGERRMAVLRDLGADPTVVRTEAETVAAACRQLESATRSLPFSLVYRFRADGTAELAGSAGIPEPHAAAPALLDPADPDAAWPVAELADGATVHVPDLADRFADLPTGGWDDAPVGALVVPLPQQGRLQPLGFLVAALNRYRPADDSYRSFVGLVAGQIAARMSNARAYEQERLRAERLAELDEAKTTFFTNISHEFRTPLTLLLGPTEDALADTTVPLADEQRARFELVQRNGERLLRLVNSLLEFSRIEAGRSQANVAPVDLARYTAELASAFATATDRVGLRLDIECTPLSGPVWVDEDMWAKVVLNLLSNALKFTFDGGITVRLVEDGPDAVLTVTDTGIGIAEDAQQQLFERFTRIPGARSRSFEGSGIGLALVGELVALHGGTVGVRSAPGEGSSFSVRIPRMRPDDVEPAEASHEPVDPASSRVRGFMAEALRWSVPLDDAEQSAEPAVVGDGDAARPVVVVADDNADMRDYVRRLLDRDYRVLAVDDGLAALALVRRNPPDLLLTDVMMPGLDGFGLVRALRDDPATAEVPIVMLSARAGEEATVEGLDTGADDYLVKPFSARELLARVRANLELDRARRVRDALERGRRLLDQAQRLARVGSWEVDLATGRISASAELVRQFGMAGADLENGGFDSLLTRVVDRKDQARVRSLFEAAARGEPLDFEVSVTRTEGRRTYRVIGELDTDDEGRPVRLRGSQQDVTDQHAARDAVAAASATREVAEREMRLANELQASLLPRTTFDPEPLQIATYYRAGVEGTQVGGDWYDVIELGAGRTALVMGDVMGRGVKAAAVMGQLRAAVRAYARLDLPPADVLEYLDGLVRDLGDDQIVTCVYAVYDPGERTLAYANAGHLPPLVRLPGGIFAPLAAAAEPPLGAGPPVGRGAEVELPPGALLALYTDGLVESRTRDLDDGIELLAAELDRVERVDDQVPGRLVSAMLPGGPDDDVAILLAHVEYGYEGRSVDIAVPSRERAVQEVRDSLTSTMISWGVPEGVRDDVELLASELTTNAIIYASAPVHVRLRLTARHVVLEVYDAATYLPRRMRPTPDDEHGRGLQLVALLAERWGTRPTERGKAVWCVVALEQAAEPVLAG